MTQSNLSHRSATTSSKSAVGARMATLCREIFGNGRQLVAARDRTGTWILRAVDRDGEPPRSSRDNP